MPNSGIDASQAIKAALAAAKVKSDKAIAKATVDKKAAAKAAMTEKQKAAKVAGARKAVEKAGIISKGIKH